MTQRDTKPQARAAEDLVVRLLRGQSWRILGRNFRWIGCELDIVATKGETLAVIEVKARRRFPRTPAEAALLLPREKRTALVRGARAFITRWRYATTTVRFDLVLVANATGPKPAVRYFPSVFENETAR